MKKVLILGAGLVVKPMVEFLLSNNYAVKIATTTKEKADRMIKGHPNGSSLRWSSDETEVLDELVRQHDIVVSFLPYRYHAVAARACIKSGKPLVTTSYVQPEIKALEEAAKKSGTLLLNEIGLDPGIDHMTAKKVIDHIHSKGGKVEKFWSLCGALPAPEDADNPMKYKFSWSPKGVVLASRNSALYLKNGEKVNIESIDLFKNRFSYDFPGVGEMEVYPNRDSISYMDIYGIPEVSTIYRGTFRFRGWCETLDVMKALNMLDDTIVNYTGKDYAGFLSERSGLEAANLRENLALKLGIPVSSVALDSLEWLGFFSNEKLEYTKTSPFEITAGRMISKMMMSEKDRDMVVMQHVFLASYPGGKKEVIKSSMLDFGSPETNTAIARTVALPASVAVVMILEKKINLTGVYRPVVPEIYNPVISELRKLGIEMKEEYGLPESELIDM
ncbi:MAG TPA: saccharopine dehydrogenase C-terminal domain-containing protein [Bacteroidales bacterium]|jgi:saccharopine dehydrogenase-like NADP-dependent oxidoreductase|nr:saccharopine dehydrogenase [Bacteroidales bacterium]HNY52586.1 saccharopine dehydrogenase C-terminal domain-containing protein [Bacteroidales bacterium]HOG56341.1 saccharopine dehydrogenase C-terminal domain-containing protein [Bacteroidales bacterium]HPX43643.1 saccharopine dehydrogenase C-terminal domain-containing protein [Bacteroidales bacterium]HQB86304.1 saccharopine dehydrogenase C-terminal domain-containing protein [Bacteroidales bacterium]